MVKIAIAGGTGNVAQEVIDALAATEKHEILLLSRKDPPTNAPPRKNVSYTKADYKSVDSLTTTLSGVHTVLSFIAPFSDQAEAFEVQKNLIDASIKAGVKRLAPSEWVCGDSKFMPWYDYKAQTRAYLAALNTPRPLIEYCCFQPGLFTNYLVSPHPSATHLAPVAMPFDLDKRRMLICEGGLGTKITFTTVQDMARVVVQAVEYAGVWPVDGGIKGTDLSQEEIVALGEKLRGSMAVETIPRATLEEGTWTSSWLPKMEHPSFPAEHIETYSRTIIRGLLLGLQAGDMQVSDSWNRLLPDFKAQGVEEFLTAAWEGKP